jgi:hypothetical protein
MIVFHPFIGVPNFLAKEPVLAPPLRKTNTALTED